MKVFHGSTAEIQYPLANIGRENLDFGKGFYVTNIYNQAERWASVMMLRRPGTIATINIYELNIEKGNYIPLYTYSLKKQEIPQINKVSLVNS